MSDEIAWENSLSRAIDLAKDNNRLILIDFSGST
jgi:hypothetical protein